jgi:hypothetical protein
MKFSVTLLAIKDACDGPNRNRGAVTDWKDYTSEREREGRSVVLSRMNIHHLSKRLDIAELMEAEQTKVHNPQTYLSSLDKTFP